MADNDDNFIVFEDVYKSFGDLHVLCGLNFTAVLGMTDDMASLPHVDSNVRIAIVAGRDLEVGLSHMFQTLADGRAPGIIEVFRTIEEAEAWLAADSAT